MLYNLQQTNHTQWQAILNSQIEPCFFPRYLFPYLLFQPKRISQLDATDFYLVGSHGNFSISLGRNIKFLYKLWRQVPLCLFEVQSSISLFTVLKVKFIPFWVSVTNWSTQHAATVVMIASKAKIYLQNFLASGVEVVCLVDLHLRFAALCDSFGTTITQHRQTTFSHFSEHIVCFSNLTMSDLWRNSKVAMYFVTKIINLLSFKLRKGSYFSAWLKLYTLCRMSSIMKDIAKFIHLTWYHNKYNNTIIFLFHTKTHENNVIHYRLIVGKINNIRYCNNL